MTSRMRSAVLLTVAILAAGVAGAHEVRPALLQIELLDSHHFTVLWKQPVNGEVAVHLRPRLSGGLLDSQPPSMVSVTPSFALEVWRNLSDERVSLDGQTLSIEGLEHTITDVLVIVSQQDGRSRQALLTPRHASMRIDLGAHATPAVGDYLSLGVVHILTGFDHLLFVFGLLLLVGRSWALLRTITAFTVAHSVTLAASALDWLRVNPQAVEALVALSIVILAVELVRQNRGETGFTARYPWLIAFAFGLLHGCAFAGALAEVGLPQDHIPLALLLFNLGVELGQLLFIGAVITVLWLLPRISAPAWTRLAAPYAIGSFASCWLLDRFLTAIGFST